MSKVKVPLPIRPEPPSVEMIVEDLRNATYNDIVFRHFTTYSTTGTGTDSYSTLVDRLDGDPDVESVYKEARRFITLAEQLRLAPDHITTQLTDLEKTGVELASCINTLEQKTQAVDLPLAT